MKSFPLLWIAFLFLGPFHCKDLVIGTPEASEEAFHFYGSFLFFVRQYESRIDSRCKSGTADQQYRFNNSVRLHLDAVSSGFYFVEITSEAGQKSIKKLLLK